MGVARRAQEVLRFLTAQVLRLLLLGGLSNVHQLGPVSIELEQFGRHLFLHASAFGPNALNQRRARPS